MNMNFPPPVYPTATSALRFHSKSH